MPRSATSAVVLTPGRGADSMGRLLVTSGPTREPLDPVRFLSNASSGRMGAAIASEALSRGLEVDIVTGPVEHQPPDGARVWRVVTASEMLERCRELHAECDLLIGAAAVCDFRPADGSLSSKRSRGDDPWTIELVPNPDILAELGRSKGDRVHAGFALETVTGEAAIERARDKLRRKRLDWIVLNPAPTIGAGGGDFHLIGPSGEAEALGQLTKAALAAALLDRMLGEKPRGSGSSR